MKSKNTYRILEEVIDNVIWFYPQELCYNMNQENTWEYMAKSIGTQHKQFLFFKWNKGITEIVRFQTKKDAVSYLDDIFLKIPIPIIVHDYP